MEPTNTRAALCEDICHLSPHSRGGHKPTPGQVCTSLPSRTKPRNGRPHAGTLVAAPLRIARSSRSLRRPSERTVHAGVDGGLCRMANPQILDRPQEKLGQMNVAPAFVMPGSKPCRHCKKIKRNVGQC
ncbi:uncharacterized protein LOC144210939 isoform X2 [Stigmatopora nigra]